MKYVFMHIHYAHELCKYHLWSLNIIIRFDHVSDIRVLNSNKESVLHWACKGEETNEELVEFIVKKR